jgi:hypothetical protein
MHERNSSLPSTSSYSFLLHFQNLLIIISGTLALQVMQFASISFTATQLYATLPNMNPQVFLCTILQPHIVLLKVVCLREDQCPFLRYSFAQPPHIIKQFSANFSSIFQQFSMLFPCLVYGPTPTALGTYTRRRIELNFCKACISPLFLFLDTQNPRYDWVALTFGDHTTNIKP